MNRNSYHLFFSMKILDFGSASTCLEPVFYADSKSEIRFEISLSVQKL